MSKIVKLNIKDINNIVTKILSENEFDDFDAKIQPEELQGADNYEQEEELKRTIAIGKGTDGKIYVTDVKTGEILGTK